MRKILSTNKFLFLFFGLLSFQWAQANSIEDQNQMTLISIGKDSTSEIEKSFSHLSQLEIVDENDEVAIVKIHTKELAAIGELMHEKFHRCGGYVTHNSLQEASDVLSKKFQSEHKSFFVDYSISESDRVQSLIPELKEENIRRTINKLSSYHNRYYTSETGVAALMWLKETWTQIAHGRNDVSVELYQHKSWPQPTLILTIEGQVTPQEVVVIGGHADSIAGYWNSKGSRAPGADDNASGIATITEIIRVLLSSDYQPEKTIRFMAYAAEEVGLKGSGEVAASYRQKEVNVIGVVQFDMTGHQNGEKHIALMSDYTNKDQNQFLGKLIDTYVHVPWGYSQCGYGCSDHVSWHNNGYAASMPFETEMNLMNKKIHTANDTLENLGSNAHHPLKFAKLGLSFAIEMAK